MQYKKGSFIVIPNKQYLKGRPSEMQSIYFWLCEHANEDGICFPTRKTISKEAGVSLKYVDKSIKSLVKESFISKITRKKENSKENISNLYQILIIDKIGVVAKKTLPSSKKDTTPSSKKATGTISNINSNNLTENLSVFNSLTKNKNLIKQKLRVEYINGGSLPIEEEIEEIIEYLLECCISETSEKLQEILSSYGL